MDNESVFQKAYIREKKARLEAEAIANTISYKLYHANQNLELHIQELDDKISSRTLELEQANSLLKNMLHKDRLTELPNRIAFELEFQNRQEQLTSSRFALLTCDINDFRAINRVYGHSAADSVLSIVGHRLQRSVGKKDFVARIAGDEFAVIIDLASDLQTLRATCQQLLAVASELISLENTTLTPQLSIGVACFPKHGSNLETLLMSADFARSIAKRKKLNASSLQFFEDDLKSALEVSHRIAQDLHTGMELNQFYLCFQPIISLSDQRCEKFEALLRWQHPVLGNIPPDKFIPIAEETGAIIELGKLAIRNACKQIRVWLDEGIRASVAVNISTIQFTDKALLETINTSLDMHGVPAELLGIEVTETVLANNTVETSNLIKAFHERGISVSLDDFGTGYSCLSYIHNLHLDLIKIDKAFVNEIESNAQSKGITKAIIQMAHALGLKVIAEGVERREQLVFLENNDCDFIQGYYFSKPIKGELVSAYLKNCELKSNDKNNA